MVEAINCPKCGAEMEESKKDGFLWHKEIGICSITNMPSPTLAMQMKENYTPPKKGQGVFGISIKGNSKKSRLTKK